MKVIKVNNSEVFDIFVQKSFVKKAGMYDDLLKLGDDLLEPVTKALRGTVGADAGLTALKKSIDGAPFVKKLFTQLINNGPVIRDGVSEISIVLTKNTPSAISSLNEVGRKHGFASAAEGLTAYKEYLEISKKFLANPAGEKAAFDTFMTQNGVKSQRSLDFLSEISAKKIGSSATADAAAASSNSAAKSGGEAAGGKAGKEGAEEAAEGGAKKTTQTETPDDPVLKRQLEREQIEKLRLENAEAFRKLKENKRGFFSRAAGAAGNLVLTGAGLSALVTGGILAWTYFGVKDFFSGIFTADRDKASDSLAEAIACLAEIKTRSGTQAEKIKTELSRDLTRLKTLTGMSPETVTRDASKEYTTLLTKLSGSAQGSITYAIQYLQDHKDELDIDTGLAGATVGFSEADFNEAIDCVTQRTSDAMNSIAKVVGKIMEGAGGQEFRRTPGGEKSQRQIAGRVTLSNGQQYNVVITTKKPSIPARFVPYFANGAGPNNLFSTPAFTAFVDPDENSPLGGYGLVPNAVGMDPMEQRIASAIRYCYNNDIDSDGELKRLLISQINAGVGFIKKLFTNEPEQRIIERTIKYYRGASRRTNEDTSDFGSEGNGQGRSERNKGLFSNLFGRKDRSSGVNVSSKFSHYENNFENSINKTGLAMNKVALSKEKIKYHTDAVKGLEDKLTKSYFTGLDSMYNEKPKAKKPDYEKLYGFQEETGFHLVQKSHPKSIYLAEAMGDGGLVENGFEQKVKSEGIALNRPSGNFQSKYAETHAYLEKLLKVAEKQNKTEACNLINQTINQLFK
jgi:hypothetical protein